jgi:hypothetical protein
MRKILIAVAMWMLVLSASSQTPAEKFILDLSKKKFDWLVNSRYDSLAAILDDKIQFIHSNGWIQNKEEVTGDIRSGKVSYQKIEIKESQARLYSSTAIVTGKGRFEGTAHNTPFAVDLCYTEVYVKSGNLWKLASRHANKMP